MSEREDPFEEAEYVFRSRKQLRFHQWDKLGEEGVRQQLAKGRYQGTTLDWVREWLARFDDERASVKERRRDEISEENLRLASEANRLAVKANANANRANIIATIASIIAVLAIAVSIVTAFISA